MRMERFAGASGGNRELCSGTAGACSAPHVGHEWLGEAIGEAQAVQNVIVRLCDLPGCAWPRRFCRCNRNGSRDARAWRSSPENWVPDAPPVTSKPYFWHLVMAAAMLAAPFIAWLYRAEAALVVMA